MPATRYSGKPCADCHGTKGPNQRDRMRCYTCQRKANRTQKENRHGSYVEATYGITQAQYRALLAYQAGVCAICCRATGASRRLAVDHNHGCTAGHPKDRGCPECVRGILCSVCNVYIGRMRDDPGTGERMARYLRTPPWHSLRVKEAA